MERSHNTPAETSGAQPEYDNTEGKCTSTALGTCADKPKLASNKRRSPYKRRYCVNWEQYVHPSKVSIALGLN